MRHRENETERKGGPQKREVKRETEGERQAEPEKQNGSKRNSEPCSLGSQGFHSQGNKALMRDKYSVTEVSAWLTGAYSKNEFCRQFCGQGQATTARGPGDKPAAGVGRRAKPAFQTKQGVRRDGSG